MAAPETALVSIGRDGSVEPAGPRDREALGHHAGGWVLHFAAADAAMALADEPTGLRSRVLLAGEIVSRSTLADVVSILAGYGWTGELRVLGRDATRWIVIDRGVVKQAHSDAPRDRLGELLVRLGVVEHDQLEDAAREAGASRRLGRVLVERGLLSDGDLFGYLQRQAEEIVFAILSETDGHFAFLSTLDTAVGGPLLHLPLQPLLMDGLRRIDELALFRERIPSRSVCPEARYPRPEGALEHDASLVLARCDGRHNIDAIMRELQMDEFDATRAVYQLVSSGFAQLRGAAWPAEDDVTSSIVQFAAILRHVHATVEREGDVSMARETLQEWVLASGYEPLVGAALGPDGNLDAERILVALEQLGFERPVETLHRALHELVCFALFAATTTLGRETELALCREVDARLAALKS